LKERLLASAHAAEYRIPYLQGFRSEQAKIVVPGTSEG
jgi:hypothetical protein